MNILIKKDSDVWVVVIRSPSASTPLTWTGATAKEAVDEVVRASGRKGNEAVHVAERLRLKLRGKNRAEIELPDLTFIPGSTRGASP